MNLDPEQDFSSICQEDWFDKRGDMKKLIFFFYFRSKVQIN